MNTWNIMLAEQDDNQRQQFTQLLEKETNWLVTSAADAEQAINLLHRQPIDVLVLGNMNETDERKLRRIATLHQPELLIVTGTGDDLVKNITHAIALLETGKRPEIRFMDDALKNAGIPVLVQ